MPTELVFWMGKYEARFPTDRQYAINHLWLKPLEDRAGCYRAGFTAYSVRLLRDVYFLDWNIEPGTDVRSKQEIGEIESSKALSSLYVPQDGTIIAFNEALLEDPSAINTDNYGSGWLFDFRTDHQLLSPTEYIELLDGVWEQTQRIIKGQMNQE